MTVTVLNRRKDGKYTVLLAFRNGVMLRKILTQAQLDEKRKAARP